MEQKNTQFRPWVSSLRKARWAVIAIGLLLIGMTVHAATLAETTPGLDSGWFVDMNRFALSAHAGFKCQDCHGSMTEEGLKHPDPLRPTFLRKDAKRTFDYQRCRKCHELSYTRTLNGVHAKAMLAQMKRTTPATPGDKAAPACGDCHVSHYGRSHQSRSEIGRQMVSACGQCHAEYAASYMKNIHGKIGVHLDNPASAFCTDCHGAHTVVSLKKPADALPVCRRCHPKAEISFAEIVIHADIRSVPESDSPKSESVRWINRLKVALLCVVVLSLVFFFGHGFLWLLREIHVKLRTHSNDK